METIGTHLRQQREKAGVGLDHIASVTKIRVSLLLDLEADRLEELPSGVFLRGFVKAYANALDINADRGLEILDGQVAPGEALNIHDAGIGVTIGGEHASGGKFRMAHLLVLVFALLTMLGAYFLTAVDESPQAAVTSAQTTDANSGTTRSFSPLKQR